VLATKPYVELLLEVCAPRDQNEIRVSFGQKLTFADSASPYHEQPRSEHGASTQESPPREQSDAADVG
jgi:hypothetical protein